jgi:hypothetical protein
VQGFSPGCFGRCTPLLGGTSFQKAPRVWEHGSVSTLPEPCPSQCVFSHMRACDRRVQLRPSWHLTHTVQCPYTT